MNILITGGSGFIGTHLSNKLEGKITVYDLKPPVSSSVTYVQGDIRSTKIDQVIAQTDVVLHLAGLLGTHELVEKVKEAISVNIEGSVNVMESCSRHNKKLVLISKPNIWPNTYSITKAANEQFAEMYRIEKGLKHIVIKWFNAYGPGQPTFAESGIRKVIPTWFTDENIEIYGDGSQTMDLIHTTDIAESTQILLNNLDAILGKTFQVGSGTEVTVEEVANIVASMTGKKIIHLPMRPGETPNTRLKADITEIAKLGWKPRVSLEEGLRETYDWYSHNYNF